MSSEAGSYAAEEVSEILAALGNAKRLAIMRHLRRRELSVGALAELIDLSQSAVSQHLARLRALNLVSTRRERQTIFYSCRDANVVLLLNVIVEIFMSENLPPDTTRRLV